MRRLITTFLIAAFFLPNVCLGDEKYEDIVKGNNTFALDIYKQLKEEEGNLFLSPYSISTALAMTYAGARGQTATQMAEVLHFNPLQQNLHSSMGKLVNELNARGEQGDCQLSVANALWGQQGYNFLPLFINLLEKNYGASLYQVDFKTAAESARQKINNWVAEKTQDKIKDLIPEGILTALTRLVLTNAIYFKGKWASQFKKEQTREMPFKISAEKELTVPMMTQSEKFGYLQREGLQILSMPYLGEELSMIVLLPAETDGLAALEDSLTLAKLNIWLRSLIEEKVIVFFPRYKIEKKCFLADTLSAMGMKDAFSDKADFSGMNGRRDLYISNVIHQAFVEVNEEGTEAAAATAVVMMKAIASKPVIFRADHPFMFLIRDNQSGSILFLGRVVELGEEGQSAPRRGVE